MDETVTGNGVTETPESLIISYSDMLNDEPPAERVQYLERELTAALYAIWRFQGIKKKIVKVN